MKSDIELARFLINKEQSCRDRGIEFDLSFTSLKNINRARSCYYTGLPLTKDTLTVDRVNGSKGYVEGNVVACHKDVNMFKSFFEEGSRKDIKFTMEQVKNIIKKIEERC